MVFEDFSLGGDHDEIDVVLTVDFVGESPLGLFREDELQYWVTWFPDGSYDCCIVTDSTTREGVWEREVFESDNGDPGIPLVTAQLDIS